MRSRRFLGILVVALFAIGMAGPAGAAHHTSWAPAADIETIPGTSPEVNTTSNDGCPILSPDGRSLFTATNRPGSLGIDIWVATRASKNHPFGAPVRLPEPVNSAADDFCPTPVSSKTLYFVSTRPGHCGATPNPDLYVTHRRGSTWTVPVNLGCQVNSEAAEFSPSLVRLDDDDEALLYFSSNRPGGPSPNADHDIYVVRIDEDGDFGTPELVPVVSSIYNDFRPNVRSDGREMVLDSDRPDSLGGTDIYASIMVGGDDDDELGTWTEPVNLGSAINSTSGETRASFSRDGSMLVFGTTRTAGQGNDIWFSTRPRPDDDEDDD